MIFSFVVDDEQQINKYQLVLRNYTRENGELLHKSNSGRHLKNEDLAYKAKLVLETLSADEICEFLEFHLSEFSGSNNEFLNWVVVCLENEYLSRIQPPGIGQLPSADYIFRNIRGDNSNPIATPMFNTIRNWVENKKNNIVSPSVSNIAAKTGLNSTLSPEQIETFWEQLKSPDNACIDVGTTLTDFATLFTEKTLPVSPIKWMKSNRLLSYLFTQLFTMNIITCETWQSRIEAGSFFINRSGKKVTANDLAVAKTEFEASGNPKGFEKIDAILKTLRG